MLLLNETYIVSKARVDHVNESFRIGDHPYQWIINMRTAILRSKEDFVVDPSTIAQFTPLSEIQNLIGNRSLIDVLVIVIDKLPQRTVSSRGKLLLVQDLGVIDQQLKPVALTLWSNLVESIGSKISVDSHNMPVVQFSRFVVNTYYGVSMGSTMSSTAIINPTIPEASQLIAWKQKNIETLREIASAKQYISPAVTVIPVNSPEKSSISSLLASPRHNIHCLLLIF